MKKKKVTELHRLSISDFKRAKKQPIAVVLDNIRSLHNVGSLFRTADAFRINQLILCGITAQPPSAQIHKTALGAENAVDWKYMADCSQAVISLKNKGYKVFAVEQVEGSIDLKTFQLPVDTPCAVIFGNEVKGVQQAVIDLCDGAIEIHQYGTKHSLNVAVSAGIVLYTLTARSQDRNEPAYTEKRKDVTL